MAKQQMLARLKPHGKKMRCSIDGVKFRREHGWKKVSLRMAAVLKEKRLNHMDPGSPLVFDVVSEGEAFDMEREAEKKVERKTPAQAPVATGRSEAPQADDLPIEEYDDLNVATIRRKLSGGTYSDDALEKIAAYERTHKNRKTVLQAIDDELEDLAEDDD